MISTPVVFVVTDTFHPAQLPLIEAVLRAAPAAAVVASPADADDVDLAAQLQRLTGQVPEQLPPAAPAHAVSCPDHDEEVRWVVRTILGQVTGPNAIAPDDIAVLYPPASAYARAVRDELERAGLVISGPTIETVAGSMAGQALRLLLDAFDEGCDREHVLHVVAVAPEWPSGAGRRRNAARWRRLCREAGVVTAADWARAVDKLAEAQRARRERTAALDTANTSEPDVPTERDVWDQEAMGTLVHLAAAPGRRRCALRTGPHVVRSRGQCSPTSSPTTSDRTSGASCTGPTHRCGNAAPPNRSPRCSPR